MQGVRMLKIQMLITQRVAIFNGTYVGSNIIANKAIFIIGHHHFEKVLAEHEFSFQNKHSIKLLLYYQYLLSIMILNLVY